MTADDSDEPMQSFVCNLSPMRVIFGSGTLAQLPAQITRLNLSRVLILTTPGHSVWAVSAAQSLGRRCAGAFTGATMHTPLDVTEAAMRTVSEQGIDGLVAIGGGSTIGLAKAIALRTDLVQVAVPTTYSGSEMTSIVGETRDGVKSTQRSQKVVPDVVLYDVDLTLGLGPEVSAASGMNAIAHAVEALYAQDANPLVSMIALQGVARLSAALPKIVEAPLDLSARSNALYGSWLCGICLGSVGMSLHHKLCHVLGGAFGLPHAQTHAAVLPHAVAYNSTAGGVWLPQLAAILGSTEAATGLYALLERLGIPRALKDLGMPREGIEKVVDLALANPYWNPRPLERGPIRELIMRAWTGAPPQNLG